MKKRDLSPERAALLVPVEGRTGAFALCPPATPRTLNLAATGRKLTIAHQQLGKLQEAARLLPNQDIITRTLYRREAVQSSQIEGTVTDIDGLLEYEATGMPDGSPVDVVVTMNYVKALQYGLNILRNAAAPVIDESLIQGLHRILTGAGTGYRWTPGAYRTEQNWIGGATIYDARFVPPPASAIAPAMCDLINYLENPHEEDSHLQAGIVVRMAIAHAQFETIHPFPDGNGRVGRLLLPLMLAAEGYAPLYTAGFLSERRSDYYDALLDVQLRGNWQPWVDLFATAVYVSAKESMDMTQRLLTVRNVMQESLKSARADSLLRKMPEIVLEYPVVSARQLAAKFQVSFPTAKNTLDQITAMGYLQAKKLSRETVYVAHQVVNILSKRPEPEIQLSPFR